MTAVWFAIVLVVVAMIIRWCVVAERTSRTDGFGGLFDMEDPHND